MKLFFKIALSLITLAFTVVLVAFLYVLNMDANDHKEWIAGQIEESAGLQVAFNGNIGVTFYPWLGITVEDVVVSNPPGFSDTPLLQAEHASFRARFMPLFSGEYEVDTIELGGARIHLETNAAGEANWQAGTTATSETEALENDSSRINRLVIGGVSIENASLTFDDIYGDVRYEFTEISVSTDELVYGEPVNLFLGFNGSATRPQLSSSINLTGTMVYDLDNQRYDLNPLGITGTLSGPNVPGGSTELSLTTSVSLDLAEDTLLLRDFSLGALDSQFNANINGYDVSSDDPRYQINLAAAGNDLALIFQVLENQALVDQITALNNRTFRVNGLIDSRSASGSLNVSGLEANLLDADIRGDLQLENLQSETPLLVGTLSASGPDLPTLLEVAGALQGSNSELSRYGRELQQAPDQSFQLDTRFDANFENGVIDLPEFEASLLGTSIRGNISASGINTDTPVFRGSLAANGPDLPLLMQVTGQMTGGRESPLNEYGRKLRGVSNKSFSVDVPFDVDMATGDITLGRLNARMMGIRVDGFLSGENFQDSDGVLQGQFTVDTSNISDLMSILDQPEAANTLDSISVAIGINGSRTNLNISPLSLDLFLTGPRITDSPALVSLTADSVLNLESESLQASNIALTGLGTNLSGNVSVNNFASDTPSYAGHLSLPAINLRRLMRQLDLSPPETMDTTVLQSFGLDTDFSGNTDNLQLTNLSVTLDDSGITGELTAAGLDNEALPPILDFDLEITSINLDRYLSPENETPESSDIGNTELPIQTLRDQNIKGNINVGQLTYSNINMQNLALSINAVEGDLVMAPISANLYQGSYSGDIRLSVNGNSPVASLDIMLDDINVAPLLQDFMDASYVSGIGDVSLSLTGRGTDTATIKRNLNGAGAMELHDGVLQGVDIGSVLAQVETMIRDQRPGSVVRGERTPFETFSATIDVNNGIVTSNDLLIESNGFDVTGSGMLANLTDHAIAFNLLANVDESPATDERAYDIGGYTLPIACTGVLESPRCLPDIQAILAGAIRSAIQRGLTDLLQRAIGDEAQEQSQEEPAEEAQNQEEVDPGRELLNRALENLFNR